MFISYSHSNTAIATKILESLQALDSTLKIFIDSAELKTGTSWQQSLYLAIGRVHNNDNNVEDDNDNDNINNNSNNNNTNNCSNNKNNNNLKLIQFIH